MFVHNANGKQVLNSGTKDFKYKKKQFDNTPIQFCFKLTYLIRKILNSEVNYILILFSHLKLSFFKNLNNIQIGHFKCEEIIFPVPREKNH